ncbi:MAG TPA: ABC transporter permease [Bryobacteraceae bacterium]
MPEWKETVRRRLAGVQIEGSREAQVVEEVAQYLEDCYEARRARGENEDEAQRATLDELRDTGALVRQLRRAPRPALPDPPRRLPRRPGVFLSTVIYDLRTGMHSLKSRPAFSLMAIGMLAMGIAANAAIFSIYDGLFLRPLPVPEPDRLVDLDEKAPKWNLTHVGVSNPDFYAWRRDNSTFDSMAFFTQSDVNLTGGETAQRIHGARVTHDLMRVLRLEPVLGRGFLPEEDKPGAPAKVVMIGYGLWQRVFGGDRNIVGRPLQLSGQTYNVIGVLPPEAVFPEPAEMWAPLGVEEKFTGWYLSGIGRLKPGVTLDQARADLLRVHQVQVRAKNAAEATSPILEPLRDRFLGDFRPVARVLLGAVGVVLLIACVNIAALMMVRGSGRAREVAIRTAIGASRMRIVRQLLTENALLAVIGGLAGIALGRVCLRGLMTLMPADMPRFIRFDFDARFALFCLGVTGAAALLFGLVPALQASNVNAQAGLQETAARVSLSRGRRITLNALVAGEIALALMLLIGAGLLVQAFQRVLRVDPGFRPDGVLTYSVAPPSVQYKGAEARLAFYRDLLERTRAIPGVLQAGAATAPPLGGHWGDFFEGEGARPLGPNEKNPVVLKVAATPAYFEAIGMTLLAGRTFTERDGQNVNAPEVVINESLVRQFWPTITPSQALGRGVKNGGAKEWMRIVGVIKDDRHYGLEEPPRSTLFAPYRSLAEERPSLTIVIRSSTDPESLTSAARGVLRQINPELPMFNVRTMRAAVDRSLWARRAYSWLFGVFAGVALVMAAAGIHGVVSYAVNQRTREIGIRMALGARPEQVLGRVLASGMGLVAAGAAVGLAATLAGVRLLQTMLFGVDGKDAKIYAAVVLGVAVVGLLANWIPARRAASVDPMRALHSE